MRFRRIVIYCLLICLIKSSLIAQQLVDQTNIKIYSFEDGLSHRNVFDIEQDSSGFIWVGTISGLNRFDSKTFLNYDLTAKDLSIPNSYISNLQFLNESQLLVSLPNQLIKIDLEEKAFQKLKFEEGFLEANQKSTFGKLYLDRKKTLWTFNQIDQSGQSYLHKITQDSILQNVIPCEGNFTKRAIIDYEDGLLFSSNQNELRKISDSGKTLKTFSIVAKNKKSKFWIVQLQKTNDGTLWALSNTGLVFYLPINSQEFIQQETAALSKKNNTYNSFFVQENGNIWLAGIGVCQNIIFKIMSRLITLKK